jgi:hypothetical protein
MSDEKRQARRVPFLCEVECAGSGGLSIAKGRLNDLSTTGAFLESLATLPIGTDLTLRFQAGSHAFAISARVAHSMPQFGMGVRFSGLTPEESTLIEQLIQENA